MNGLTVKLNSCQHDVIQIRDLLRNDNDRSSQLPQRVSFKETLMASSKGSDVSKDTNLGFLDELESTLEGHIIGVSQWLIFQICGPYCTNHSRTLLERPPSEAFLVT
uniref:Uncharacterized protein n=1 Tax=Rhizophagus irregularis (strain DAOM 181602 / DAOM 197198 / MUCL 43194) TaxID=747089 RepID=U9TTX0_RHIID